MRVDIQRLDEGRLILFRVDEHQPSSTLINPHQLYQPLSTLPNTLLFPKGRIGRFCLAFYCRKPAGSAFFVLCHLSHHSEQIFFGFNPFSLKHRRFLLHTSDKTGSISKFTKVYLLTGCILFFIALPLTNFSKPK